MFANFNALYNHFLIFDQPSIAQQWRVPGGVTELAAELWGGGGAGGISGGGQGGGFLQVKFQISRSPVLFITPGAGGLAGTRGPLAEGQESALTFLPTPPQPQRLHAAYAGGGAANGAFSGGSNIVTFVNARQDINGQHGRAIEDCQILYEADFNQITYKGGRGGNCGGKSNTGGTGAHFIVKTFNTGTVTLLQSFQAQDGSSPGGGGGGGFSYTNSSGLLEPVFGGNGGNGLVIIYYNL